MASHQRIIRQLREAWEGGWPPTMRLFQYFAGQASTPRQTTVERLQSKLKLSRRETTVLVNGIIEAGIGTRIVGRRGAPSRIVWKFTLQSIEKVARGDTDDLQEVESKRSSGRRYVDYSYQLYDDQEPVIVRAPRGLTERETERIATFVRSLWK